MTADGYYQMCPDLNINQLLLHNQNGSKGFIRMLNSGKDNHK